MAATMVFIDGGYLDKVLENEHPNKRIDYALLARELASPGQILRTYYYHCLPYQSRTPTEDERRRYSAKHKFVTALENLSRFQVRLGTLLRRPDGTFTRRGWTPVSVSTWRCWLARASSPMPCW